ncbi:MAG: hypothetical protein LBU83_11100 [Bacteroidales bacterium]|jgi:hypothetical protein|nr:hypothetical protein [Bacteroidales bacterium]
MKYYLLMGHRLARSKDGSLGNYEWLINGEWKEDTDRSLALNDARVDYGDYSVSDYDDITPEIAEELIQNGTTVLQGYIGYGTTYCEPKTIQLSNWKKPNKQENT